MQWFIAISWGYKTCILKEYNLLLFHLAYAILVLLWLSAKDQQVAIRNRRPSRIFSQLYVRPWQVNSVIQRAKGGTRSANVMANKKYTRVRILTCQVPHSSPWLWFPGRAYTIRELDLEPSLRSYTLPRHFFMLWLLFRVSHLLPSPKLTPASSLQTQLPPDSCLSYHWRRLDQETVQHPQYCGANSKFALFLQKLIKKGTCL